MPDSAPKLPNSFSDLTEILVPTRLTSRVFRIKFHESVGSGFAINIGGVNYLATAQHIVTGLVSGDRVGIRRHGAWAFHEVESVAFGPEGQDVAMLQLKEELTSGIPETILSAGKIAQGQRVVYLGFPLGMEMDGLEESDGYPHPLLKTGVMSGVKTINGSRAILFESINNRGFSGGPIFVREMLAGPVMVFGVVTGFEYDAPLRVLSVNETNDEMEQPDFYVKPNSGFMRGYGPEALRKLAERLRARV